MEETVEFGHVLSASWPDGTHVPVFQTSGEALATIHFQAGISPRMIPQATLPCKWTSPQLIRQSWFLLLANSKPYLTMFICTSNFKRAMPSLPTQRATGALGKPLRPRILFKARFWKCLRVSTSSLVILLLGFLSVRADQLLFCPPMSQTLLK